MKDDNFAFWIALVVCLIMIFLIWPRQMPPAWKYDKQRVCDYGSCVEDLTTRPMSSPGSDDKYLRAKVREMTK